MELSGLRDKLYWRPGGEFLRWCCYKKSEAGGYVSLCGARESDRSGGQEIARPPSVLRCPRCDGKEMERRGWEEGGVASKGYREFLEFRGTRPVAEPVKVVPHVIRLSGPPVDAGEEGSVGGTEVAAEPPRIAGATHEEDLQLLRAVVRDRDETLRRLHRSEQILAKTYPVLAQAQAQINELHRELTKMQTLHGMDQPWPTRDVLAKLSEAAKILLGHYNYDAMGWEQVAMAVQVADDTVRRFDELRDAAVPPAAVPAASPAPSGAAP